MCVHCEVGVSEESETSDPIKTKPSLAMKLKRESHMNVELDTSLEQDNVFTVTLRKGLRGLGIMLDRQHSLAEGRA